MIKSYILGLITPFIVGGILNATSPFFIRYAFNYIGMSYIVDPLVGNCSLKHGENGHGWKFIIADYYQCDKLQRYLNVGE